MTSQYRNLGLTPQTLLSGDPSGERKKAAVGHTMSTLIEESDALYDSIPTNEEIECFIDKHEETNDPELLWRLARFSAILGKTLQDSAKKKHFATKIGEFANKGLELNPESAGCIKYYSIGIIEGCAGPTERAKHIHELKEHFKKAIEIDPQDAFAHHLLGVWHFRVADMPWLLKKIISAVHSNPPSATYEE
ncbi:hypothetical protein QZH41_012197, partial [Actinostola sp. cb2023]